MPAANDKRSARRLSRLRRASGTVATLPILLAGVVAVSATVAAHLAGWLGGLEQGSIDARFALRHQARPSNVVIVGIDDKTFSDLNVRWPFPRRYHALLLDRIAAAHPRAIAFDVQFTEPSDRVDDLALYRALGRAGGAVLATDATDGHGHTRVLGGKAALLRAAHIQPGSVVLPPGNPVNRYFYDWEGVPSLAVAAAARAAGHPIPRADFPAQGARIDYQGPPGSFPELSYSDVLRGRFAASQLRGKIVVVGATEPTLQDLHWTPIGGGQQMSGPEVQANAIWTALHGAPLRDAPAGLDLLLIALLGMVAPLGRLRFRILPVALGAPLLGVLYMVAAQLSFDEGRVVAVAAPLVALAMGAAGALVVSHLAESTERRRVARDNEVLEERVRERTEELRETQLEIIRRLGQAAESRDGETGQHIERISRTCEQLALALGLSPADAELVGNAAAMHDIGKIGIPDRVLLKAGKLDPEEWETMKTHTSIGAAILAGSPSRLVQTAEVIARSHHERWDGSGYPAGLRGEQIPLEGRICAICDVFDALRSRRPYKQAWSLADTLQEMRDQAGKHFDPRLLDVFLELVHSGRLDPELARETALEAPTAVSAAPASAAPTPAGPGISGPAPIAPTPEVPSLGLAAATGLERRV